MRRVVGAVVVTRRVVWTVVLVGLSVLRVVSVVTYVVILRVVV